MPKKAQQSNDKPTSVTYTQAFSAFIQEKNGEKTLTIKSPMWYKQQLSKFKQNENVTLVIHNRKPKRTDAQNRYLWGVYYPLIAEKTGERNLDRLHELFKGLFLTEGLVEVLGYKVRMKKSTTELSKGEFSDYIIAIENETGVEAPPTKNFDLEEI